MLRETLICHGFCYTLRSGYTGIHQHTNFDGADYKTRILQWPDFLGLAFISGLFLFYAQTIIVMSRHIEYDQKNEIYTHYQSLDSQFYKTHNIGDLMNRISEDVSRVRSYVGPAMMYMVNLLATIGFSLTYMFRENAELTLYVLAPLPILLLRYIINMVINRKADKIQRLSQISRPMRERIVESG